MANIFTRTINKLTNWRDSNMTEVEIIDQIDTIAREGINRRISENLPVISQDRSVIERNQLSVNGTSIVGKLKKRLAPTRSLSDNGVYDNRFNLSDVYSAYVGENLFKFAVDKYTEASVRNGYFLKSQNPIVVKYLNKRIKEMEVVSGSSFQEFVTDYISSLILYGNVYTIKHRQEDASSGNQYETYDGKKRIPIASLFVEDPRKLLLGEGPGGKMRYVRTPVDVSTIKVNMINPSVFALARRDLIKDWDLMYSPTYFGLMTSGFMNLFNLSAKRKRQYVVYEEPEVDHIRYHHIPGDKIAMPPFWSTLNDIDSLRRIEENIELLVYQYGHPILHGKVGEKDRDGLPEEIEDLTNKIENMESNGFIVTSNRAVIEMVGAENTALRLEAYLTYFYRRVLTGLWLSEVAVGSGNTANRSTANVLDKLSQEKVFELQRIFSTHFQRIMIELLQEGGAQLAWILKPENLPTFEFHSVDLEGKIRHQQHVLTLFQGNLISESEARVDIGMEPMSKEQRKETYVNLVSIPLKKAAPPNAKPGGGGSSSSGSSGTSMAKKVTQQKLTPRNQSGKKTGPSASQNS